MSVRVSELVWQASKQSGPHLLLLLALADFADDAGRAYPSVSTLAAKCRRSTRAINLLLADLRASGELLVDENAGPRGVNVYRVQLSRTAAPLKPASPPDDGEPLKDASPLKDSSPLKPASSTPEAGFPKPLKPASDKPSENRHEPSIETVPPQAARPKRSRIREDWQPDDRLKAWAVAQRPDLHLPQVVEQFRDHYIANGEARASWDASFRTWVRRERRGAIAESFAERDRSAGMARWEQMTGRPHPDRRGSGRLARPLHSGFEHLDYSPPEDFQ